MATQPVETMMVFPGDRSVSPTAVVPYAQMLEASGAVDYLWMWDVIGGWLPRHLWTPENSPMAEIITDFDAWYDPVVLLGLAAASTTKLRMTLCGTNCVRQGPAEVVRSMLTLAALAEGRRTICGVGTGED